MLRQCYPRRLDLRSAQIQPNELRLC